MYNGYIKTEHGGNTFMQYREEMQVAKSYKQNYLHGIEHIINQKQREAEEIRASYTKNIFEASADYREALKKMLGWPLVGHTADSTLVAGLDDREQKEEFFFFDYDSQCWFMMDSLWRTLTENLDAENIYYTMDGGQELVLENLSSSINTFPSDVPYMGSGFYAAHDDVRGDEGSTED